MFEIHGNYSYGLLLQQIVYWRFLWCTFQQTNQNISRYNKLNLIFSQDYADNVLDVEPLEAIQIELDEDEDAAIKVSWEEKVLHDFLLRDGVFLDTED